MNYIPTEKEINVGDAWYHVHNGKIHCYHLQLPMPPDYKLNRETCGIGHAVSDDMITWETLPTALYIGPKGSYDDTDLWTGCTIEKDGVLYLFYTSICATNRWMNKICVATSTDGGKTWEKHPENPLFSPDSTYYHGVENPTLLGVHSNQDFTIVDCRDFCVVYDEARQCYWGYFAARTRGDECARTSVIGLCKSEDLIHWTQLPPCFAPNKYHCVEVPDVFFMDGKWYLICMTGNTYGQRNRTSDPNFTGKVTIYAVADRPEGPFTEPEHNDLLGSINFFSGFCVRTLQHNGTRYMLYSQQYAEHQMLVRKTLSLPKELRCDATGHLYPYYCEKINSYLTDTALHCNADTAIPNTGKWGSIGKWSFAEEQIIGHCETDWAVQIFQASAKDYILEADLCLHTARSAGLIFDVEGDTIFGKSTVVLLDQQRQEILLTQPRLFARMDARCCRLDAKKPVRLKILAADTTLEIYLDDILQLQYQIARPHGRVGLFVEQGTAMFSNLRMRELNI